METNAIILDEPRAIGLRPVRLALPEDGAVLVEVSHTGISAGTERLLWDGTMPAFPGMGYPLVPGYETVGRVADPGSSALPRGAPVFVPGARCYGGVRALFGGAAKRVLSPAARLHGVDDASADMTLLALAATAHHAIEVGGAPDLVVGHGVLGRLVARVAIALGHAPPRVHEVSEARTAGAEGYEILHPENDPRRDYRAVMDASGDGNILDTAIARIAPGGRVVLAGFYKERLSFAFPAAFMREANLTVAAEWKPGDLTGVRRLLDAGRLHLGGLVTHEAPARDAAAAYATAFSEPDCLKMVLNWEGVQ